MIEDMENKIRNTLNEIYFGKTKDVVNGLRSVDILADQKQKAAMKQDLAKAILRRNAKNEWLGHDDEWGKSCAMIIVQTVTNSVPYSLLDWIVEDSIFGFDFL